MPEFEDPQVKDARQRLRTGRNAPCPCGSGRKYKKCCRERDQRLVRDADALRWEHTTARAEMAAEPLPDLDAVPGSGPAAGPWQELRARQPPGVERMDAIVDELLSLPHEETPWRLLAETLEALEHPDLAGVIRRILARTDPAPFPDLGEFYAGAAVLLARHDERGLLPALGSRYRSLGTRGYHADEFFMLADNLLIEGFESDALDLAEHFLAAFGDDSANGAFQRPALATFVFTLRVGGLLRRGRPAEGATALAEALRRNVDEFVTPGYPEAAAAVIAGAVPIVTPEAFDLPVTEDGHEDFVSQDVALLACLTAVAHDAWQQDGLSPEATLRGTFLISEAARRRRKPRGKRVNLLNDLEPGGLENRLERAVPDLLGSGIAEAELVLQAWRALLGTARRHGLVSEDAAAASAAEIGQLALLVNPWRTVAQLERELPGDV